MANLPDRVSKPWIVSGSFDELLSARHPRVDRCDCLFPPARTDTALMDTLLVTPCSESEELLSESLEASDQLESQEKLPNL